jgi:hypothetical protein
MIAAFLTFGGCGYYFSLSYCMIKFIKEYNPTMSSLKYHIPPLVFGFLVVMISTFATQNIGLKVNPNTTKDK